MTDDKLEDLLAQLTLEEKIDMIHGSELFSTKGVERLGIPPFKTSDGPRGVRKDFKPDRWEDIGLSYDFVSYLPCNTALAATWNRGLAHETGKLLGKEARGRGKDMILAPGINIMRTPLCGRSFEYMGEDPYLTSELAAPFVRGIEENDVAACVKHYALNNQETRRMDVDVKVSERALREIYLPAFKAAVQKGGTKGIMGAYNRYHGTHCCHNKELIDDILRGEWGFDGIVVSDWGGVHDTKEALMSGIDMEMSVTDNFDGYYLAKPLLEMAQSGEPDMEIVQEQVDKKVRHILHVMNELHMLDGERKAGSYNDYRDKEALRQTARESVVLLKNEKNLLPLDRSRVKKLLIIGENANRQHAPGGGSAEIKALYEITPLLGFHMLLGGNTQIVYKPGYYNNDLGNIWADTSQSAENGQAKSLEGQLKKEQTQDAEYRAAMNAKYRREALAAATDADAVICVGGLTHDYDTEGRDRESMKLPYEQDTLISELLDIRPDAVIVLQLGSPVDMSRWLDKADSLVCAWYGGMEGGYALAETIFGDNNPSGHLPETFPLSEEDCPAAALGEFPGEDSVTYGEDIFVGYRYYDTYQVGTAFPFGYGLSYTDFVMTGLRGDVVYGADGDFYVNVSFCVSNTGSRAGYAVPQLYVEDKRPKIKKAAKELKGFEKLYVEAGETKTVTMTLDKSAFCYYSEERHDFVCDAGSYMLLLAKDAEDVTDLAEIEITA
ncbi:MAG: glycoside hydrolase family 3 C-terminal domain-containing protein [Lachnospiraceae bacterium]|nr:glycoside hydrolase family 3 C-terminal domain-containing protein [Lachnospiraceae bacterium]